MKTIEIWEGNIEKVRKNAEKVIAKCQKYGCDFTFQEVGETYKEGERGQVFRYILVEVEGIARCGDWEVIASIDHLEAGNFVLSFNYEEVPSEYINAKPVCDHCHTNRQRKTTYVVKNLEDGTYRQVGSDCLHDYTGISLAAAVSIQQFYTLAIRDDIEVVDKEFYYHYYNTIKTVAFAIKTIRENGYVKKDESYDGYSCTSEIVRNSWDEIYIFQDEALIQKAQKMVDWAKSLEDNGSHYLNNLRVVASSPYAESRHLGVLVSLVPAYERAMRESAKSVSSVWLGEIGKKISVEVEKATRLTSWETQYGVTHLYQFNDKKGNAVIWKTAKILDLDNVKSITGTVKAHSTFRDLRQTELTRCSAN